MDGVGRITDDMRVRAAIPTIESLVRQGARAVVLLSHLGRPKGGPDARFSLEPVARHLATLVAAPVRFVPQTVGPDAVRATTDAPPGSLLLMENTRFLPGEERNDPALARQLAELGDLYVNDAFGSAHRAHASTEGVAHLLHPAVAGLLMERELRFLGDAVEHPARPFVAILGGAKISGKIDVIGHLLPQVDRLLVGGAMACTFFRALGLETGRSLVEADRVPLAEELIRRAGDTLRL